MAKISRRAVASSSSSASSTSSSSSTPSTVVGPSASPLSSTAASYSASISNLSPPSEQTASAAVTRLNANNNIVNGRKTIRSIPTSGLSSSRFIDTSLDNGRDGYGSNGGEADSATVDPLRNDGPQFTTSAHSNVYAYTTTTGPNKHAPYTASPMPPDKYNQTAAPTPTLSPRELIRAQFFATYDVMTGVRIAATLGGFFGLMVFLIVYKSRSSSNETLKVLKDPKMAAVAAVCMQEEEEREIQEAMVATGMSIYPDEYDAILYRRQRMLSLGNVSAPPMLNRGFRFSSVGGGYSSLLEPPRRFSFSSASGALSIGGATYAGSRRRSGSDTSRIFSNYPMGSSFGTDDYFVETDDEFDNGDFQQRMMASTLGEEVVGKHQHKRSDSTKSKQGFLEVPLMGQDSRRSSAMTCCSTDSSYLERRCSAFTLGLSNLPPSLQRKCSTASRASSTEMWDYYYPDIQVIQPTPKPSPLSSERSIYEQFQQQTQATKSGTGTTTLATTTVGAGAATPLNMETTLKGLSTITTTAASSGKLAKPVTTLTTANGKTTDKTGGGGVSPSQKFIRKHSIAYYDPESAQSGRKQQIHSISADTVDVYPYNQPLTERSIYDATTPAQSAPPVGVHQGFRFSDSPTEELRLNVRRKIAVVELPRIPYPEQDTPPSLAAALTYDNNNSFPYTNSAAAKAAANANSSSISIDSTPLSIDKLNGSGSLGTVSAKALFNAERRAPLASLSSFKISSLEYQDSEARSMDEDSVFLDSVADTEEDLRQMSSDSEEASLQDYVAEGENQVAPNVAHQENDSVAGLAPSQLRYPLERHYSLGGGGTATTTTTNSNTTCVAPLTSGIAGTASARTRRLLLQRNRTISVSSSDRVALLGHPLKDFHSPASSVDSKQMPLETHFGAIICTNSPPTHPRRAQLLQQYSDPQSQPTTTTTTTTTNTTEDDTCSTLNTEVGMGVETPGETIDFMITGSNETIGLSTTTRGSSLTHHSSLNTVVSFGRISPLTDSAQATTGPERQFQQQRDRDQQYQQQQLPISSATNTTTATTPVNIKHPVVATQYDPCASSISDSFIHTKETLIKMPSSLKSLILHKPSKATISDPTTSTTTTLLRSPASFSSLQPITTISRSATDLSFGDNSPQQSTVFYSALEEKPLYETRQHSPCPSVMLELPLIRLPTTEEDSSSIKSATELRRESESGDHSRSCKSDEASHHQTPFDPSLPSSSRKWSKETLF
uniref:Mucin-5AC n=1 Tax=Musca domestica TaxID=7370 RepID=A0A1I8M329_MUSDO